MENTGKQRPKNVKLPIHGVSGSLFYQQVEKLINEWKEKELGEIVPFSPEAEIDAGFRYFLEWLKKRDE